MESGLRPAATQLDNCLRRFVLRLASLPKGDQARELVGADKTLRNRLQSSLGCWDRKEGTVLLEVASTLEATVTKEEESADKQEAKRTDRPGLAMFTDGSRLEYGASGYAVAWKKVTTWKGHKAHKGWGWEAYDTECAGIARALRVAATRDYALGTVTTFTDA